MNEPSAVGGLLDLTGRVVVGGGRNGPREGSVLGSSPVEIPDGYRPNHPAGVTLPVDFEVTPLQYVD